MFTAFCLCSEQGSTVGQCLWKTALGLVKQILRRSTLTEGLSIENPLISIQTTKQSGIFLILSDNLQRYP